MAEKSESVACGEIADGDGEAPTVTSDLQGAGDACVETEKAEIIPETHSESTVKDTDEVNDGTITESESASGDSISGNVNTNSCDNTGVSTLDEATCGIVNNVSEETLDCVAEKGEVAADELQADAGATDEVESAGGERSDDETKTNEESEQTDIPNDLKNDSDNEHNSLQDHGDEVGTSIEVEDCDVQQHIPDVDIDQDDADSINVCDSNAGEGNVAVVPVKTVGVAGDKVSSIEVIDNGIPNGDNTSSSPECKVTPLSASNSDELLDTDSDIETQAKIAELSVVSLESDTTDSEAAKVEVSITGSESETDLSKGDGSNVDLTHSTDSDLNTVGLPLVNTTDPATGSDSEQAVISKTSDSDSEKCISEVTQNDQESAAYVSDSAEVEVSPSDTAVETVSGAVSNTSDTSEGMEGHRDSQVCVSSDSTSINTLTAGQGNEEVVPETKHVSDSDSINQEPHSSAHPRGSEQILTSGPNVGAVHHSTDLSMHTSDTSESQTEDQLLSELDCELLAGSKTPMPGPPSLFLNGLKPEIAIESVPEYRQLKGLHDALQKTLVLQQEEIERLKSDLASKATSLETVTNERENLKRCHEELLVTSQDNTAETKISELQGIIAGLRQENETHKKNFAAHDAHAKKTIAALQNEMKDRIAQVTKRYEDSSRDKEGMVVKYAQAEQKNIEMQNHMHKMQLQMRDVFKEKEQIVNRIRSCRAEKQKAVEAYEARTAELNAVKRELEKQKEQTQAAQTSTKWAQNKLKVETDSHKETKWRLEDTQRKLNMAKEETEMIRADCQAMIKTYQESEEVKSNSLDLELKEKEGQLKKELQEKSDQAEIHTMMKSELENLKRKQKELLAEVLTWKDKVACMDTERKHQETTLTKFKETLQKQKADNQELRERLSELEETEQQIAEQKATIKQLETEVNELRQSTEEMESELKGYRQREGDSLGFTERTIEKNARLQSENSALQAKVIGMTAENERITSQYESLKELTQRLEKDLTVETKARQDETQTLSTQLEEKSKCVESLTTELEEQRDENKTLKRRHAANMKDLTRQFHQAKKRLEAYENKDSTSMGSRTSSNGSLDTLNNGQPASSRGPSAETTPQEECPPIVEVVEIDKQMLVEKIVRLQRAHARKNEKLEFQEDHINQLLDEVKKKHKLIQEYVMREETGTLAPATRDVNKAQMSKKAGIMASMYTQHVQDGSMTLELSLEINNKLQAVLEDTLIKNITLKENIDTLGAEIARLSQENRRIQLQLQGGTEGK